MFAFDDLTPKRHLNDFNVCFERPYYVLCHIILEKNVFECRILIKTFKKLCISTTFNALCYFSFFENQCIKNFKTLRNCPLYFNEI